MSSATYRFRPVPTEGAETLASPGREDIGLGALDAINRVTDQVLITGESGTGKDLMTGAIHRKPDRSQQTLFCMNWAAISPSPIAAEV
jgi:transcriptional regulator with GAF, ATPase, and Fis domain